MNSNHTIGATVVAIAGSVVAAYSTQIQALATAHPTATFVLVGIVTAIMGALPSSTGAHPDGPQ